MSKHYRAIRSFLPTATAVGKRLSRQTSQEIVLGGNIGIPLPEASSLVPRSSTITQSSLGALRPNGPAISATSSAVSASSGAPFAARPAESFHRGHHDHSCSPSPPPAATPCYPSSNSLLTAFPAPANAAASGITNGDQRRRSAEPPMHAVLPVFGVAGRAFPGRSPRGFPSSWSDSEPPAKSAFPAAVPRALSASDAAAASSPAVQRGELLRSGSSSATCGDLNAEFLQQHDWMQRAAWMRLATAGDAGNGADDAAAADAAERDYSGRRDDEIGDGEKCAATADDDSALDASNRTVEVDRTEQSKTVDRRNDVRVASSATRFLPKPPTASGTNPESVSNGDEDPAYWVDSTQTYHSVGWIGSNEHRHHETRHRDERFATARAPDDTYLRASHTRRSYLPHDETNAAGWLDDRDRTAVESWVNDSRRSLDEMWMDSARSRIRDAALQLVEAQQAALEHSRVASAMEAAMLERQKSLGRSPGGNGIGGKVRKSMLSWSPPANDLGLSRSSRSSPMRRLGGGGWGGGATGDNVGVARSGDGHDIELVPGRGLTVRAGGSSPLGRVGMMLGLGSSKGVVSTS